MSDNLSPLGQEVEQRIDILKRLDLIGHPWEVSHFDHDKEVWAIELCDTCQQMRAAVLRIAEGMPE